MVRLTRNVSVSLREITEETLLPILRLKVGRKQQKFVATNAVSIAQAYFNEYAWFRAIYADETPVGFVMLYDNANKSEYFLWRLMIDKRYQQRGFGEKALDLLIEYVKTRPKARELFTSCVPGDGSPEPFYIKYGFSPTGEVDEGENVLKLDLKKVTKQ